MRISKLFLLLLVPYIFVYADIYSKYKLGEEPKENYFNTTNFEKIVRFEPLYFDGDSLTSQSSKYIAEVADTISQNTKEKKNTLITIIGHSHSGDDDTAKSQQYSERVQSYFTDTGIDINITQLEARGSQDPLFYSDASLSNRVMVTMYEVENPDRDNDGVFNEHDKCPDTQAGIKVSEDGCKIATVIMLMDNHKANNAILVKSGESELLLDEPNTYTSIASESKMSKIAKMSDEQLTDMFGDLIASSNEKHYTYILYFKNTQLLEDSKKQLDEIIEVLSKNDNHYIKVSGHTDTIGSEMYNKELSQKRVDIITQVIQEHNLKYLSLATESYGESNLAIPTADNTEEILNRRVEVFIH